MFLNVYVFNIIITSKMKLPEEQINRTYARVNVLYAAVTRALVF